MTSRVCALWFRKNLWTLRFAKVLGSRATERSTEFEVTKGLNMSSPLEQAFASTRQVMAAIQPDQLQAQTPCESWDVAGVINHVVGGAQFFIAGMRGQQPSEAQDWACLLYTSPSPRDATLSGMPTSA